MQVMVCGLSLSSHALAGKPRSGSFLSNVVSVQGSQVVGFLFQQVGVEAMTSHAGLFVSTSRRTQHSRCGFVSSIPRRARSECKKMNR